jgi:hypothetical protein
MVHSIYTTMTTCSKGAAGVVAHTCNPSYLGSEDLEDCSSKPTQAKSSWVQLKQRKAGHGGMHLSSQVCEKYKSAEWGPSCQHKSKKLLEN